MVDVNNNANNVGEWYINEELDLAYFSVFTSDSIPADTSTDVNDDPWSAIDALTSLHAQVRSSFTAYQSINNVQGTFFEVPARCKGKKLILFGRVESNLMIHEDSKSETELPRFSHYEPNVLKMMENMGYDLTSGPNLNFGKGR